MKIGIDISQTAYEGTGVGNFVINLVQHLLRIDDTNEYVLFFSSMRKRVQYEKFGKDDRKKVTIKTYRLPPLVLDLLWNKLHIIPIESFIGDVFISSDWTQPPLRKAKGITILYDMIVYKYPEETHNRTQLNLKNMILSPNIVAAQKRRMQWVVKECQKVICISESTKRDAQSILGIEDSRLEVIHPGMTI